MLLLQFGLWLHTVTLLLHPSPLDFFMYVSLLCLSFSFVSTCECLILMNLGAKSYFSSHTVAQFSLSPSLSSFACLNYSFLTKDHAELLIHLSGNFKFNFGIFM